MNAAVLVLTVNGTALIYCISLCRDGVPGYQSKSHLGAGRDSIYLIVWRRETPGVTPAIGQDRDRIGNDRGWNMGLRV